MIKLDTGSMFCATEPLRELGGGYKLGRLLSTHWCTGSYIVSKEAAARLYQPPRLMRFISILLAAF